MSRFLLLLTSLVCFYAFSPPAQAEPGDITFVDCVTAEPNLTGATGCIDLTATTNSIRGFESVVVSADGRHVYAASSFSNAVVHFAREPGSGGLVFADCLSSNVAISGCTDISGIAEALNGAVSLRLSPDGLDLYVVALLTDSIIQLGVTAGGAQAGAVSFVDCWSTLPVAGCTDLSGVTGSLNSLASLAISADGNHVYTTADTSPGALTHFSRGTGGTLAFESCISGGTLLGCTDISATTNALDLAAPIVISPDDQDIYVGTDTRGAVIHFSRDPSDGSPSFVSCLTSGASTTGCTELDTTGARRIVHEGLTISPDGRHLYAASLAQASVVQFDRSAVTGALSLADCITTAGSTTNCRRLQGVGFGSLVTLAMAPDGTSIYAGGLAANAVFGLDREVETGTLTFNDCISSEAFSEPCLDLSQIAPNATDDPEGLAVSPGGNSLYIGSDAAFLHTDRERPGLLFSDGFES